MCFYSIFDIKLMKWEWLFHIYQIHIVEVDAVVENIVYFLQPSSELYWISVVCYSTSKQVSA